MIINLLNYLLSPANFELHGFKVEGPVILLVPALIVIICCFVASLVWLYKDAKRRSKNGIVAILFILLTGWPVSFLWWLWLRPPLDREKGRTVRPNEPPPAGAAGSRSP
jgi:hypothetical protein